MRTRDLNSSNPEDEYIIASKRRLFPFVCGRTVKNAIQFRKGFWDTQDETDPVGIPRTSSLLGDIHIKIQKPRLVPRAPNSCGLIMKSNLRTSVHQ